MPVVTTEQKPDRRGRHWVWISLGSVVLLLAGGIGGLLVWLPFGHELTMARYRPTSYTVWAFMAAPGSTIPQGFSSQDSDDGGYSEHILGLRVGPIAYCAAAATEIRRMGRR